MPPEKSRRAFLSDCGKMLGSAAFAAIALPVLQGCDPSSIPVGPSGNTTVDVSDLSETNPAKEAPGLIGPDGRGVLVTRKSDTEYYALSMKCTHQGCDVESTLQSGTIPCLCHGSKFNLDGTVHTSPATSPLPRYGVTYDATNNTVTISFS